ncbi:conserved hypothetical protein [Talaromyces stipitatus ATCC 10500]|uniref:Uncharacterized protein n=1 Tax=Talaromyces stipitatus (strain ATCC 10500 / CBS 375.48 / QM 6759 / NRRL 1006) TaxID=441959 RepID=B8MEP4_TALSN|nr:uncharacterized protein TSTA_019870 [Talaromyces stipitatus ATCC 10500]EED16927.1 conserved hypothetical protein [Talaromyces stipitatus ATCC 10500]
MTATATHQIYSGPAQKTTKVAELQDQANTISKSLPIYTSWNDILQSSPGHESGHESGQVHPLTTTNKSSSKASTQSHIHKQKPHFLLNAAFHTKHCIIGQGSKTEALLVVLRRPWCVLEICVSNNNNLYSTKVLELVLAFARTAQRWDYKGYETAVFLLGFEIEARHRLLFLTPKRVDSDYLRTYRRGMYDIPARKVYEICNTPIFLPSLRSFNSFWIRLICVCAVGLGVSFSEMIYMLCHHHHHHHHHHRRGQSIEHDEQRANWHKSDTGFSKTGIEFIRYDSRRHSASELRSSCPTTDNAGDEEDIVAKMLYLYKHILGRTEDSI